MSAGPPRAFTAIVNPVSGTGGAAGRWARIAPGLAAAGADVRVEHSRSGAHATELAVAAAAAGRVAVAVGGDGLVRDVAGGVVPAGGTMAVVAAGRGNDLVRRLGLPTDPAGLTALLTRGPVRHLDVIEVGRDAPRGSAGAGPPGSGAVGAGGAGARGVVLVPGNVYAGIDSVANAIINRSRLPGWLAYRTAPLRAIASWRPPVYALECDGRARSVRAHTVVVANTGAYGHGLAIVPPAEPDDGRLHVMLVGAGPRRAVAAFLWQARTGAHVGRPEVEIASAGRVRLSADRDLALYGDGDEVARLPVTVRVRPAALRLLVGAT